jgi:DNA-binding GntR family transcriptional regulator
MKKETGNFTTLAEQVYITLRDDIANGRIAPGSRLVRRSLAKQLNVSAIPVTEALFRLQSDGLVESAPMYGARVIAMSEENALEDLILREALECQAARECAVSASDDALAALAVQARQVDAVMQAGADPLDAANDDAHGAFHLAIAHAGGSGALAKELQRVWFRRHMHRAWVNATRHGIPPGWHWDLVVAIATRNPGEAEAQMRYHVRWTTVRHQERRDEPSA